MHYVITVMSQLYCAGRPLLRWSLPRVQSYEYLKIGSRYG